MKDSAGTLPITDHCRLYLPNTHDQIDHGDGVKVDAPEGHEAQHADLDGDDGECDPERAHGVRDEDQGDEHHDPGRDGHALDCCRQHHQKLNKKYFFYLIFYLRTQKILYRGTTTCNHF